MSQEFVSRYVAHKPDKNGIVHYSQEEQHVWQQLFTRQIKICQKYACAEFLHGLKVLGINKAHIPQLPEINKQLKTLTNWQVVPVTALISARHFFELLANKKFPAATFIRFQEDLDYVKEPDIFHELFGHCPMLTNPLFAKFMQAYAKLVLTFKESDWALLQRLFWFTVEFGLINTTKGIKAYGGGILSSIAETAYSIDSELPIRVYFNILQAFRTPYRIDELQKVYFVIPDFATLFKLTKQNLKQLITEAKTLGEFPPLFKVEANNPSIHIFAC
ncbi:MAG: phenylalanine 4-monooxygenase [Legionellales bacterium RIFCSPHIGHO2_12_FULL_37_14]|nr:MAG: phenylalanine 4-monooxygenase [Legionellales bacterium RIFCSPHIGHO2_12_FULL_37_14]